MAGRRAPEAAICLLQSTPRLKALRAASREATTNALLNPADLNPVVQINAAESNVVSRIAVRTISAPARPPRHPMWEKNQFFFPENRWRSIAASQPRPAAPLSWIIAKPLSSSRKRKQVCQPLPSAEGALAERALAVRAARTFLAASLVACPVGSLQMLARNQKQQPSPRKRI